MTDQQRRQLLRRIGTAGALLAVGGAGTAAANGRGRGANGPRRGASAPNTIFEIAESDGRFSTLVAALETTGLDDVLDGGGGQYTVFAPTNAAFEALADERGVEVGDLLELDGLENILLYHVTRGRRYAPSVVNPADVGMLNGDSVSTDGTTLNDGQATIAATDIKASNGVVHVITGVLRP
ncbi:fasciclin domain-containing protein [Natronomonas marina]|uniref:fasciclin domain-containing protein n=1 Tax=Natronomonas marina TaxID=2961939 RepID=UPI0020C940E6|nr:fasciclin domain-containing protein [Natronomonas marina]